MGPPSRVVAAAPTQVAPDQFLPEADAVAWRRRVDEGELRQAEWLWGLTMVAHVVPFLVVAVVLVAFEPLALPVSLVALAHAWIIPELYAQRGANVARPPRRRAQGPPQPGSERVALGLLGDLVSHEARDLHARTGLVVEEGRLGVWLVGQAGALLLRPGGRRVHCWCVRVDDPDLPAGDRIAHLLLALRLDEQGFATVANRAFAGARWRVRRRLDPRARPALDHAGRLARR
ncbi:MAG: hypothetical protein MSC31_01165 [Solirubrobacteraceae bacterium MAG38_C4-C5]|nr:hypothetical protein [Candidatus Siliceabacter maunaloa]